MDIAAQATKGKQTATAIIALKNAIQLQPENQEPRFLLAKLYHQELRLLEAEKELRKAIELGLNGQQSVPLLMAIYRDMNDKIKLQSVEIVKGRFSTQQYARLRLLQAQSYIDDGQTAKSFAALKEVKQLKGVPLEVNLALALELVVQNELQAAMVLVESVLNSHPKSSRFLKLKANIHLRFGQLDEAAKGYAKYLELEGGDSEAKLILARLYSDLNRPNRAEPLVDELLSNYPGNMFLTQLKIAARVNSKDFSVAYRLAEHSLRNLGEDDTTRLLAGVSAYFGGDYKNASRHLSLVANILPDNHMAMRLLADSQLRLGLLSDAKSVVMGLDIQSDFDASLVARLGSSLVAAGELKKAKETVAKQNANSQARNIVTGTALTKLSLRDFSGVVDLESLLTNNQFEPNSQEAQYVEQVLVRNYLKTEQYQKALEVAERWQQNSSTTASGLALQANVMRRQGDAEGAKQTLGRAVKLAPENPSIALKLLELSSYESEEQVLAGLASTRDILSRHPDFTPAILFHYLLAARVGREGEMLSHLQDRINKKQQATKHAITLAKLFMVRNDFASAVSLFESAKEQQPQPFWRYLAEAYKYHGQPSDADKLYQEWFDKQPNSPLATAGMVEVLMSKADYSSALDITSKYIREIREDVADINASHCQLLIYNEQLKDATQCIVTYLNQYKETPLVQGLNGQLLLKQGKPEPAVNLLQTAYFHRPSPQSADLLATALLFSKGQRQEIAFLKYHLGRVPKDFGNSLRLADSLAEIEPELAETYYLRALELAPDHFVALNNLAHLLSDKPDLAAAYEFAMRANKAKPRHPVVLATLGTIELKLGKNRQALSHLSLAYEQHQDNRQEELVVSYIEALLKNDQVKLAERRIAEHRLSEPEQISRLDEIKRLFL
mgnify:CR=1 FL=1